MKHLKRLIEGFALVGASTAIVLAVVLFCGFFPWVGIPIVVLGMSYMYGTMLE
jgi:hypothetical protein